MIEPKKTYHIITFGCQMNERDSETLAGLLEDMGYAPALDDTAPDVVILNTCSVRENADKRFFGVLGQWKNKRFSNPGMIVAVCGCMMQQEHVIADLKEKYPWVDVIFGTHNIHRFPELLACAQSEKSSIEDVWEASDAVVEHLPARRKYPFKAYVNIMYGCNNFCTYCIVPYTRGRERSRQPEDILNEIRMAASTGAKEVTLLGQNVNSYGLSPKGSVGYRAEDMPGGVDFAGLLRLIDRIPGIERIRFMTSHPKDISQDLIRAYAECEHVCKHIHLPVQSGSDRILAKMNRKYDRTQYMGIVSALRESCPDIAVTTDIIVGFPGETEQDFSDTLDLVRRVQFDSAFTFLYSTRKGTPAQAYQDQIPRGVKQERFDRLIEEIHRIQGEKSRAYVGRVVPVLVEGESRTDTNRLTGRTDSSKVVDFAGPKHTIGRIVPVRITDAGTFSLSGVYGG